MGSGSSREASCAKALCAKTLCAKAPTVFPDDFVGTPSTLIAYCPCPTSIYTPGRDCIKVGSIGQYQIGRQHRVKDPRLIFSALPGDPRRCFNMKVSDPDNGWLYVAPMSEAEIPMFAWPPRLETFLTRLRVKPTAHVASCLVAVNMLEPLGQFQFRTIADLENENCKVSKNDKFAVLCTRFIIDGVPYTLLYAFTLISQTDWPGSVPYLVLAAADRVLVAEYNTCVMGDFCLYTHLWGRPAIYRRITECSALRTTVADTGPMLEFDALRTQFWQTFAASSLGQTDKSA